MRLAILSARHPSCDPGLLGRYDALYRGGPAFRSLIAEFLPANPLEPLDVYELRKRDASYRGYVGPIGDFFAAQLYASPFLVRASSDGKTAVPDAFYAGLREDTDMNGTDMVAFMKAAFLTSLVKQAAWILAEKPDDEGIPAESRADWEARDLGRVRLCLLDPLDVLDWECDAYGGLLWAITHKREMRRDNPRFPRQMVTETWRVFDGENVETFQVVYDPKRKKLRPTDDIQSLGIRPHGFSRVPLVQMRLPEGLWLLNRAADAQTEHFRLSAALSWAIKRACYPMAVFKAKNKDSEPTPVTGAGYLQMIDVSESFEWVSPQTAPFEVIAAEIDTQKNELYRLAQQMAASVNNSAAGLQRSGDSKQADLAAIEVCLHAYAVHAKAAMEATYELVSDGRGDFDVHFSIEGLNHFNLNDIAAALANLKAAKDLAIPSKTLTIELGTKAAEMLLPDADQRTKDTIRGEIQKGVEEQTKAPPPPGPNAAPPGVPGVPKPAGEDGKTPPPPTA